MASGRSDWGDSQRRGLRLARVASSAQTGNLTQALDFISKTETGKKVLRDIGSNVDGAKADLKDLSTAGVDILVGDIIDYAVTNHKREEGVGPQGFWITIDRKIIMSHPAALAAILGHELAHIKDRRDAGEHPEIKGPTERRGYLLETHIALELLDLGLMPAPDLERTQEALLLFDLRQRCNVWLGKPISPRFFGSDSTFRTRQLNAEIQNTPGLRALLAYSDLIDILGEGVPNWDAETGERTPYVRDFYARLEREDEEFAARRNGSGTAAAQSEYSIPLATPSRPPAAPLVLPKALAVAVPVDNEMMRKLEQEESDVQARHQTYLQDIARWSCAHTGGLDREDIGYINHSIDWILEHGRFHGLARPSRAAEGLSGCAKELLEDLIVRRQSPPPEDQLDPQWANDEAARLVEKNKPTPPPPSGPEWEPKKGGGWEYKPAPSDYRGPCGNLGSGCTW